MLEVSGMDFRFYRVGRNSSGNIGKAGLWTDSRYFLQAEAQLEGSGIDLYRLKLPDTPSITDFLLSELKSKETVGLNGATYSAADAKNLKHSLARNGIELNTDCALLDELWKDRPALPGAPILICR